MATPTALSRKCTAATLRASRPATRDAKMAVDVVPMLAPKMTAAPVNSVTTPPAARVMMSAMTAEELCKAMVVRMPISTAPRMEPMPPTLKKSKNPAKPASVMGGTPSLSNPKPTNIREKPMMASPRVRVRRRLKNIKGSANANKGSASPPSEGLLMVSATSHAVTVVPTLAPNMRK